MKTKGYYSRLYQNEKRDLQVHFFEPSVLDHFKEDPNYNFDGNKFYTKHDASIEPSGIQQFMWARKGDQSSCIAALLAHLVTLSYKDQLLWQSKELSRKESTQAKIESRYVGPMLYGQWPDTMSRYAAIYMYLIEIQKIFHPERLFPALPEEIPDFLVPLSFNQKRAFTKFMQDLYTILDIKSSVLATRIRSPQKKEYVDRNQKRKLLSLYFKERRAFSTDIQQTIDIIKEINDWRVPSAHRIQRSEKDQDYNELQHNLAFRLQSGLRRLLVAFALAEKGSTEMITRRVLELNVE
jgi:hypothetical protein